MSAPTTIQTDERCVACGRTPRVGRDGSTELYQYRVDGPIVCSIQCDKRMEAGQMGKNVRMLADDYHSQPGYASGADVYVDVEVHPQTPEQRAARYAPPVTVTIRPRIRITARQIRYIIRPSEQMDYNRIYFQLASIIGVASVVRRKINLAISRDRELDFHSVY